EVGEGGSLWDGNTYFSPGVDVRNTSTSTGESQYVGKIDFNVTQIPEPSALASLLIGGGVIAFAMWRRRMALNAVSSLVCHAACNCS
ncbi:MAG: PEP-CTERM sorting domain-containing protein, partial [Kiritimatiellae bacterium]|nr:PEP-CTERM sorting domain-containing protein [Kiritimatiellia bacterium]